MRGGESQACERRSRHDWSGSKINDGIYRKYNAEKLGSRTIVPASTGIATLTTTSSATTIVPLAYMEALAGIGSVVKPLKPRVKVPVMARQLMPWTYQGKDGA